MQLPLSQAQQIMEGQKTTHRTRRRPDVRRGSMLNIDGWKMAPDPENPGEMKKVVTRKPARVRVLSVCRENDVQALTEQDIRAEGFRSKEKFLDAYEAANGVRDGACWVLRLEVADRMRLLLPAGRPKFSEKGYGGGSDVLDAGEAVSEEMLSQFGAEARARFGSEAGWREQAKSAQQQLRDRVARAHAAGVDPSEFLARIQRELDGLKRSTEEAA